MSFTLELTSKASKDINKLSVQIKEKIDSALQMIEGNPYMGKKLTGEFLGQYSIRIWPYRVIYEINLKQKTIIVFRVGHRQGVYK